MPSPLEGDCPRIEGRTVAHPGFDGLRGGKPLVLVRAGIRGMSAALFAVLATVICLEMVSAAPALSARHARIPQSFEVVSPAEFQVPANRQVVRADMELRNTSRCWLCMGTLCCEQWRCGLVPSWRVKFLDDTEGPVVRNSVRLGTFKLSGNRVAPGKRSCPVPIEFNLKDGSAVGDQETFCVIFTLTNPRTGEIQTVDWKIDVAVRKSGLRLLVSEKLPFPSEMGK